MSVRVVGLANARVCVTCGAEQSVQRSSLPLKVAPIGGEDQGGAAGGSSGQVDGEQEIMLRACRACALIHLTPSLRCALCAFGQANRASCFIAGQQVCAECSRAAIGELRPMCVRCNLKCADTKCAYIPPHTVDVESALHSVMCLRDAPSVSGEDPLPLCAECALHLLANERRCVVCASRSVTADYVISVQIEHTTVQVKTCRQCRDSLCSELAAAQRQLKKKKSSSESSGTSDDGDKDLSTSSLPLVHNATKSCALEVACWLDGNPAIPLLDVAGGALPPIAEWEEQRLEDAAAALEAIDTEKQRVQRVTVVVDGDARAVQVRVCDLAAHLQRHPACGARGLGCALPAVLFADVTPNVRLRLRGDHLLAKYGLLDAVTCVAVSHDELNVTHCDRCLTAAATDCATLALYAVDEGTNTTSVTAGAEVYVCSECAEVLRAAVRCVDAPEGDRMVSASHSLVRRTSALAMSASGGGGGSVLTVSAGNAVAAGAGAGAGAGATPESYQSVPTLEFMEKSYFKGTYDRAAAVSALSGKPIGTCIVRYSSSGNGFTVTYVATAGAVVHTNVKLSASNQLMMSVEGEPTPFESMNSILSYLGLHIPPADAATASAGLPTTSTLAAEVPVPEPTPGYARLPETRASVIAERYSSLPPPAVDATRGAYGVAPPPAPGYGFGGREQASALGNVSAQRQVSFAPLCQTILPLPPAKLAALSAAVEQKARLLHCAPTKRTW